MGADGVMDARFTEHSARPVLKGDKKIAVQWMRYDVDKENPWNSFDTCKFGKFISICSIDLFQISDTNFICHFAQWERR